MTITTLSSKELNQKVTRAIETAKNAPTFITDYGKAISVLMIFERYQAHTKQRSNIPDALDMPGVAEIEFEPPHVQSLREPDLS